MYDFGFKQGNHANARIKPAHLEKIAQVSCDSLFHYVGHMCIELMETFSIPYRNVDACLKKRPHRQSDKVDSAKPDDHTEALPTIRLAMHQFVNMVEMHSRMLNADRMLARCESAESATAFATSITPATSSSSDSTQPQAVSRALDDKRKELLLRIENNGWFS